MYQILLLLILSFNCSKVKSDKKYSINNLYYKDSLIHSISNDKIISGYIYQDIPKKWVELIQQKNDLDVMGYIKDGKPDGSFSILYDNGSIIGDSTKYLSWETKIDGKNKDGYFTEYYDDGKLIDIISTSEIFSVGVNYEKLFECGELICNSTFGLDNYGETIDLVPYSGNVYELNDDGKKILTGSYEDGRKSGEWIFWDNDVKSILVKNNYLNGVIHGESVHYFDTGEKQKVERFKFGIKDGESKYFHELSKSVKKKGRWKNGKKDGEWNYYWMNQSKWGDVNYSDGILVGVLKLYNMNGVFSKSINCDIEDCDYWIMKEFNLLDSIRE